MKQRLLALVIGLAVAGSVVAGVAGCASETVAIGQTTAQEVTTTDSPAADATATTTEPENSTQLNETTIDDPDEGAASASSLSSSENSILDVTEMFTDRDLDQSADLNDATYIALESDTDLTITEEGVYVLSGEATNLTVTIEAADEAKVQLVLDGATIVNDSSPVISVISADKVFVTLADTDNHLEVSGAYESASLDAVVFSKSDLVFNGTGSLEVVSNAGNGITSKDDLKITGGTYYITSALDGIEANDSIRIYDGNLTVVSSKDALHSENSEDPSLGYVYIANVTLDISAADDGIQGNAIVQIDGGVIDIQTSTEGIEGTYVQINGGKIDIYATDDGINAAAKSAYDVVLEINGDTVNVQVGGGDTDGLDSNGDIYINGGAVNITANSAFDYWGIGELNGGDVTVNGETVTQLAQSQMGRDGGKGGR